MKSLEENQTELFTKWQSETSELKGQLDKARANEKTTKEKIRRASLSVEKVRMNRTFYFGKGERAEMILTYLSLRSSQVFGFERTVCMERCVDHWDKYTTVRG